MTVALHGKLERELTVCCGDCDNFVAEDPNSYPKCIKIKDRDIFSTSMPCSLFFRSARMEERTREHSRPDAKPDILSRKVRGKRKYLDFNGPKMHISDPQPLMSNELKDNEAKIAIENKKALSKKGEEKSEPDIRREFPYWGPESYMK